MEYIAGLEIYESPGSCQTKRNEDDGSFPKCCCSLRFKFYHKGHEGFYEGHKGEPLTSWLRPFRPQIGKPLGRIYTVLHVDMIFTKLGVPLCADGASLRKICYLKWKMYQRRTGSPALVCGGDNVEYFNLKYNISLHENLL